MVLETDVAIVGAGTAGSAAAALCARRGLRVVCLERRALNDAGARWINGVPGWTFDEAGFARPRGDELFGAGHAFHLVAGSGPERVIVREHDLLEVDMRFLVARLQDEARAAGATLIGNVEVRAFDGVSLETSQGRVRARWFVDAAGLGGAGLVEREPLARDDLCAAAQQVHAVRDVAAARGFFESQRVAPGDTLCFTGIAGGYSVLNVRLEGDRLGVLTGSIPAQGYPSGQKILDEFVAAHAWVGPKLFGGSRAIPLRAPLDRLAHGRVALLGDAACQVFSAHGSGIGAGLVAARLLSDALADGRGPSGYESEWHRRYGALFRAYDLFRRLTQTLRAEEIARLMAVELLDEANVRAGLEQRWPPMGPSVLASVARGALRAPTLAARLAPVVSKMAVLRVQGRMCG